LTGKEDTEEKDSSVSVTVVLWLNTPGGMTTPVPLGSPKVPPVELLTEADTDAIGVKVAVGTGVLGTGVLGIGVLVDVDWVLGAVGL
jgi:hypothetical protein